MSHYEIIYEDGSHSVAEYDTDAEALSAAGEQHRRAVNGEKGGPDGHPAARVKRVLKYSEHPANFGVDKTVAGAELYHVLDGLAADKGTVDIDEFTAKIRDLSSAVITDSAPHDTNYKMAEDEELVLPWA